jgi:hypothetical protein
MDLIQGIWPAWLGLEKRDLKFTGTGASTSVPSVYNIINHFFNFYFKQKFELGNAATAAAAVRRMLPSSH